MIDKVKVREIEGKRNEWVVMGWVKCSGVYYQMSPAGRRYSQCIGLRVRDEGILRMDD